MAETPDNPEGFGPRRVSLRAPRGPPRPAGALGRWVAERADSLEVWAQGRAADGPMIDRALALVREFIVERERIAYGGFAIDCALRLRGARLYPDNKRPDYDFLSPDSVGDAYDLADRLVAAGFPHVSAFRGIHLQTMRVWVSFVPVADLGYAPRAVFDRVPTLDYQGVRVVHPHWQRMDQHLAFCFPFGGCPREDVFHRWKKDLSRWNLLDGHYPLTEPGPSPPPALRPVSARLALPVVTSGEEWPRVALHGFAAYAALRAALDDAAATLGGPADTEAPRLRLTFAGPDSFEVETPEGVPAAAVVATPCPEEAVSGMEGVTWYDPYLDLKPITARVGGLEVYSTSRRLLAVSAARATGTDSGRFLVVTPQYLLVWFLYEGFRAGNSPARRVYHQYYIHTLDILRAAEKLYMSHDAFGPPGSSDILGSYASSPFAPSVTTLGSTNQDTAYQLTMARNAQTVKDIPPAILRLPPDLSAMLQFAPASYHPKNGKTRPTFDYEGNPLFRREGLQREGPAAT